MSNTFEHNSATHKQALQKHFSRPTDYGFFTALRQPDEIETMSWGGSDALPLLLDCVRYNFYHTYLVKHEHAQALVSELVDIVHETANHLKGTKR